MDAFLSLKAPRTFIRSGAPTKNTVLQGTGSKWAGKEFLVKIKYKMLLQTLRML